MARLALVGFLDFLDQELRVLVGVRVSNCAFSFVRPSGKVVLTQLQQAGVVRLVARRSVPRYSFTFAGTASSMTS